MPVNILLPLDGSAFSEHALPAALDFAQRLNGRLHIVRVHEPPLPLPPDGALLVEAQLGPALRVEEEEYLRSVAQRAAERGVAARTQLLEGPVATAIAGYVQDAGISAVVMTTHGRGGISRAWVGSVADAVMRRSAVPVMLLRPHDDHDPTPCNCRNVLIPLDGSALAEGILPAAQMLSRTFQPKFTLLRVVSPLQLLAEPKVAAVLSQDPAVVQKAGEAALAYLEQVAGPMRAAGAVVETAVQVHAIPAVAILDFAATHAADMIAMATHGRGGWSRVALGSVADKVMRGTQMPVLLFRPPAARVELEATPLRIPQER